MHRAVVSASLLRPSVSVCLKHVARPVLTSIRSYASSAQTLPSGITFPPATAFVGTKAPRFKAAAVVDGEIKEVSLSDFKGKYVVLVFYPKDFTYVCPTELIAFSDRVEEFHALNTQVIAISCDTEESHLAWTRLKRNSGGLGHMQIPIVADSTKEIANNYGVLIREAGIALRGLFIIDKDGVLQQSTINNLPIGRSVDETIRLISALQHVEEFGEVCPAGWKPGDKSMKANPTDSQDYFSSTWADESTPVKDLPGNLKVLSKGDSFDQAVGAKKTVVMVSASWCGKCAQIYPFFVNLAKETPSVNFVKVDITDPGFESVKDRFGVESLPGFLFLEKGAQSRQAVTGFKKQKLEEELRHFIA